VWKTFQSLSVRNYRLFATGQLGRLIAVWMIFVAQDWLVLRLSGDSASAVGITVALQFTPVMLLSLVGGALADRYDKRKLLLIVNSAWSVVATILAVLVLTDMVRLWHVFMTAALIGVANAMENPIRQSFISELVGNTLLPNALALNSAVFNTARIAGPAFAGGAIALVGLGPTFLIAAVAAISPLLSLSRMRPMELYRDGVSTDRKGRARIVDGLRYVARRSDLVMPIALVAVVGDRYGADPDTFVRLVGALDGIPLRLVSQADARRNVTLVIDEHDLPAAMSRLHAECFERAAGRPAGARATA